MAPELPPVVPPKSSPSRPHPLLDGLVDEVRRGTISRRRFLRLGTLLGLSAWGTAKLGGWAMPDTARAASPPPQRGGTLVVAAPLPHIAHPAQIPGVVGSSLCHQVIENLTVYGSDNVTRPYLLEGWEASTDLRSWMLNLRQGITWSTGEPFTARDVAFTCRQWSDPSLGSTMYNLIGAHLETDRLEQVGEYQLRLTLKRPDITLPEHLAHHQALILNARSFRGEFLQHPVGTGPFILESFEAGRRARLRARHDYWQKGLDDQLLPYLDAIEIVDMGTDPAPQIEALKAGRIHLIGGVSYRASRQIRDALKGEAQINVQTLNTAATRVLRMRADIKPFNDHRIRQALKLCQDRDKILALVFKNEGVPGQDTHVSPVQPDYCPIETPAYQPERAKALLAEAGYPKGLKITLTLPADYPDIVRYGEILKQDARAAGFDISINALSRERYQEVYSEMALGIAPWSHQPLGLMALNAVYRANDEGQPADSNETHWVDDEFTSLLSRANSQADPEARRPVMCRLEQIQQERGTIGVAFWMNTWMCTRNNVQGLPVHPRLCLCFDHAWLNA